MWLELGLKMQLLKINYITVAWFYYQQWYEILILFLQKADSIAHRIYGPKWLSSSSISSLYISKTTYVHFYFCSQDETTDIFCENDS